MACSGTHQKVLLLMLVTTELSVGHRLKYAEHVSGEVDGQDGKKICIGCKNYPEAPDYPNAMENADEFTEQLENLSAELRNMTNATTDPSAPINIVGRMGPLQQVWNYLMHAIFKALQGQQCMDLCALCIPKLDALAKEMANKTVALRSFLVDRGKNWQDWTLWPLLGPVDSIVGAVWDVLRGLPYAFLAFFGGGTAVGAITGGVVASQSAIGSFAGNLLGLLAGLSSGVVSGAVLFSAIEILAVLKGFYKGVGLVAAVTDCKRVGFEQYVNGEEASEQPFENQAGNPNYGLKKLRNFMKEQPAAVLDGDTEALKHCERVREHSFDMRHATECVKHSQICGGEGILFPAISKAQCMSMSSAPWLEDAAVAMGDDVQTAFSAWRLLQTQVKQQTNFDGKQEQCKHMMCQHGGMASAEQALNMQALQKMGVSVDEKLEKANVLTFLAACANEFNMTMNSPEERNATCGPASPSNGSSSNGWPDLVD